MKLTQVNDNLLLSECDYELLKDIQSHLVRLNYLSSLTDIDGILGAKTRKAWKEWKIANFLTNYELIGSQSASIILEDRKIYKSRDLSINTLKRCFPHAGSWTEIYHYPLNFTMQKYEIITPPRQSMFLAQIAQESGELRYREEISSGHQYENRTDLGNIFKGDGERFKGRGFLRIAGRSNYQEYGKSLGLDLVEKPELALEPLNLALIAGCQWEKKGLNKYADLNSLESFRYITKRLNGSYNSFNESVKHWERIRLILEN